MDTQDITLTKTYTITLREENMLTSIGEKTGRKKSDIVREGIELVYRLVCEPAPKPVQLDGVGHDN